MAGNRRAKRRYVCVISDATGATAERVVRATLAQFGVSQVEVEVVGRVKTEEEIRALVERTKRRKGLVAYTLVENRLRGEVASLANEAGVETVDLIGPLLAALGSYLSAKPAEAPGIFEQLGEEHYERLDSVSFTVRHDDGLCLSELELADIVLAGPSRTSKTPLSVYLAHTRGLRVANVPLALGVEPPEELVRLPPGWVAGLTMRADVLSAVRRQRLREIGNPDIEYANISHVERELHFCHGVYRAPPSWPVVDVTGKSIEEIAGEVVALTVDSPRRAS